MKISIIGTGYVGLVTGVCLAEIGHNVICVDSNQEKIKLLEKGRSPIYEPGLEELLRNNIWKKRLTFTTSVAEAVRKSTTIIIAVGTPSMEDGSIDMRQVDKAAEEIGKSMDRFKLIVNKSTVPVGTTERVKKKISANLPNKKTRFAVLSNPEFLREGNAIHDTFNGDRIIIGSDTTSATNKLKKIYAPLKIPYFVTDPESAEMIKYASNAFLATKISFINEVANVCERVGADIQEVARGIGMDKRIGESFLKAGIGYGGSCFPKDVNGLISIGESVGYDFKLLKQVVDINRIQRVRPVKVLEELFGNLSRVSVGILGLAFKPDTDDIREAPSLYIISKLLEAGAKIKVYDPAAMKNAGEIFGKSIEYCVGPYAAAEGCDALIILTEWKEFREMDLKKVKMLMKGNTIIDGRNILAGNRLAAANFDYFPVGIGKKAEPQLEKRYLRLKLAKLKALPMATN